MLTGKQTLRHEANAKMCTQSWVASRCPSMDLAGTIALCQPVLMSWLKRPVDTIFGRLNTLAPSAVCLKATFLLIGKVAHIMCCGMLLRR